MKVTTSVINYTYEPETLMNAAQVAEGTLEAQAHTLGLTRGEALIILYDSMLKYAKAYRNAFESPVAGDAQLGPAYLAILRSLAILCLFQGAIAMRDHLKTDSKADEAIKRMQDDCLTVGGFKGGEEL